MMVFAMLASTLHGNEAIEDQLAREIAYHSAQQRAEMVRDPILDMVARHKARSMATRDFTAHIGPDGFGPNRAIRLAGYGLPDWWPDNKDDNHTESLGFGYSVATVVREWYGSAAHKRHVFGEGDFFGSHTHYGVGYAYVPDSKYQHYYVFLSAPPNEAATKELEPYRTWLFDHHTLKQIAAIDDADDLDGDGLNWHAEFALGHDPYVADPIPSPTFDLIARSLTWPLSPREDLGSIRVIIEHSRDLELWKPTSPYDKTKGLTVPLDEERGYFRLQIVWAADE